MTSNDGGTMTKPTTRAPLGERDVLAARRTRLRHATRGAVVVEYSFLLIWFVMPVAAATVALGVSLVKDYTTTRNNVLHEGP
jgi:hypothetical protein